MSAGVFAVALAVSGGLAASAAPAGALATNVATASQGGFVDVSSTGFLPNESVDVKLDGVLLDTEDADGSGNFSWTIEVPAAASLGLRSLTASAVSGTSTGTLTVVAQPTITPAVTTITASAFAAGGVKIDAAGFVNGDSVQFGGTFGGTNGPIGAPVVVAGGAVSLVVVPSSFSPSLTTGDFTILAGNANSSYRSAPVTIHVVADPAAPVKGNARFTG